MQKKRTGKLELLELGRGLAASAVVAKHASLAASAFTSGRYLFNAGDLGVDFFFVLSGFIITVAHGDDAKTTSAAFEFVKKRLRRIYVPYLPVAIVLILAYLLFPHLSEGHRTWGWITSLTLFPTGADPVLHAAWTLPFEMTFYAFFLLFYATRFFGVLAAGWALMVLGLWITGLHPAEVVPVLKTVVDPLVLEFLAGMLAAYIFRFSRVVPWPLALAFGAVGIAVFVLIAPSQRVVFGLAMAPTVLGLAIMERQLSIRLPRPLTLLGAASYAIYLVHNPLQSLVARALRAENSWMLTFLACIGFGIAAGIAYHLFFERPVLRFLNPVRRKLDLQPSVQPVRP